MVVNVKVFAVINDVRLFAVVIVLLGTFLLCSIQVSYYSGFLTL